MLQYVLKALVLTNTEKVLLLINKFIIGNIEKELLASFNYKNFFHCV